MSLEGRPRQSSARPPIAQQSRPEGEGTSCPMCCVEEGNRLPKSRLLGPKPPATEHRAASPERHRGERPALTGRVRPLIESGERDTIPCVRPNGQSTGRGSAAASVAQVRAVRREKDTGTAAGFTSGEGTQLAMAWRKASRTHGSSVPRPQVSSSRAVQVGGRTRAGAKGKDADERG